MADSSSNDNSRLLSPLFIGACVATLVIIGAFIRINGVGDYHFSTDEMMHVDIAQGQTLGEVLHFSRYETHPPLGYFLLHYWRMFSDAPAFLRSLALIFGLPLIPLYYFIGKKLDGPLTGLLCAIFITFSYGCISQSYIARNYSLFMFFLSCGFYFYLHWQQQRTSCSLLLYTLMTLLACCTHFSGIFFAATLTLYETRHLLQAREKKRRLYEWLAANAVIALGWLVLSCMWWNTLHSFTFANLIAHRVHTSDLLIASLFYPLLASYYLMPLRAMVLAFVVLLPLSFARDMRLRAFLALLCIALGLGMVLFASNAYTFMASRKNLWLLPFMLPAAAWVIANACEALANKLKRKIPLPWLPLMAIMMTALLWAAYSPHARFTADNDSENKLWEYTLTQQQWQDLTAYLPALDNHTLVLTGRDDVFLFAPEGANPYRTIAQDTCRTMSLSLPYYSTLGLFFPTECPPRSPWDVLRHISKSAAFAKADTLVFLSTGAGAEHFVTRDLVLCATLDKKILTFPAAMPASSPEEISHIPAIVLMVSRQVFQQEGISPTGKAHGCFK
jgi:4-amino-4-deoxy-L-arabinose transferase-like glycosyltransferase